MGWLWEHRKPLAVRGLLWGLQQSFLIVHLSSDLPAQSSTEHGCEENFDFDTFDERLDLELY